MSFRIRLFGLTAVLAVATVSAVAAQRGTTRTESFRIKRPAYSYFRYRIPEVTLRSRLDLAERVRERAQERQRTAMERVQERQRAALDRQFAMRDRIQERVRKTQELTLRRSLEARERAMVRVRERLDRVHLRPMRPYRYWRTI